MKLNIKIDNLPYLPLNRAKMLARGFLIKTALCREFEKDLTSRIESLANITEPFVDTFNSGKYFIGITYNLYCPKSEYFTKAGDISSRCPDADSIKVLQDTIFRAIGIDDKYIKDLYITVRPSEDDLWNYNIELQLHDLGMLYI